MAVRADIKKIIQDKTPATVSKNKSYQKPSITDNPMFAIAQGMVENMPTKYKLAISGLILCTLTGVGTIGYGILKLILSIF